MGLRFQVNRHQSQQSNPLEWCKTRPPLFLLQIPGGVCVWGGDCSYRRSQEVGGGGGGNNSYRRPRRWGGGGERTIPIADPRRWGGGGGGGGDYSYRRSQDVDGGKRELFLSQIPGSGGGKAGTIPIADPRRWGKRELFLSQIPGSGGKRELFLPLYMVTTIMILALMGNGVNHSNVPLTAALVEQSHNQAAPMNHDGALSLWSYPFISIKLLTNPSPSSL